MDTLLKILIDYITTGEDNLTVIELKDTINGRLIGMSKQEQQEILNSLKDLRYENMQGMQCYSIFASILNQQ